ncbi:MAG: cyclopropane-fatty-acyl-phospholipid synthase [bacterium]|nr:MAG: cyclopropane-fatty-acyl-phospholipid synthase [bacterium]KAF0148521.1 MAG: cyclopropane-fatty-acyl-phospholipid synthase [bacterium]KAF0168065.1 MAG: cyclopropane-fatty-acyl-phospholipid synthase [bacterium]TXT21189.1 MAG: cyclopropane-fatty-acyl-phospholipid synthase [bacterium]
MTVKSEPSASEIYDRILSRIQKHLAGQVRTPFEIRLWGDRAYRFGEGEPAVEILVRDRRGLSALGRLDEVGICEAYMAGSLDVMGDMLRFVSLRGSLRDSHLLDALWRRVAPWVVGRFTTNRRAIAAHYEFDNDFYLQFLDPTRCYSQAVFERDDEDLETAQRRKLDFAIEACRLKPGDRVLDVGSGWGTFTEHAGRRGIRVTGLTLSRQSERFQADLIRRLQLPAQVLYEDFLMHDSPEPYDAIVILGVMEHLPDYPAVLRRFQSLLKPGGRVYLDASAFREKYVKPTFVSRYVFPGDHSYFCLHDFLAALARTPMEVLAVHNDRHSYYLTCKAWAENLEAARDEITRRWGETLYRRFRLYLWGSAHAFLNRGMEAYRVLLERPHEA